MRWRRQADLEAIADSLERLALEIRDVTRKESSGAEDGDGGKKEMPTVQKGQRVRITIRGPYRGRTGTIMGPHGTHFWDIKLDPLDGGIAQVIYKKMTSFVVMQDN